MIRFTCPSCAKELCVQEEAVGRRGKCPNCGDSVVVPASADALSSTEAASTEGLAITEWIEPIGVSPEVSHHIISCPFCDEQISAKARKCKHCGEFLDGSPHPVARPKANAPGEPEKVIWEGRPSPMYYILVHILGIVVGIVTCGVGLLLNLWAVLDQKNRAYTITNTKVISKIGIICRKTTHVAIRDIRVVNLTQGIVERLTSLGTVEIGTAGTGEIECMLTGIEKPAEIRDLITGLRETAA